MRLSISAHGMAVITDVGDPKDIHPRDKNKTVGARWPWRAGHSVREPIEFSGPFTIRWTWSTNGGAVFQARRQRLGSARRPLTGFTVAGEDGKQKQKSRTVGSMFPRQR